MAKALTPEEIAKTEKKLDMPLDEIIKMSKVSTTKAKKKQRAPNKSGRTFNNSFQEKAKFKPYTESRRFVRQGVLAQRRTNFLQNQFPVATQVAQKAVITPFRVRPFDGNMKTNSTTVRARAAVQRRPTNGGITPKWQQQQQQQQPSDADSKQRPKTLDSLFANLKEQRMKVQSHPYNAAPRSGYSGQPRVPWARGRYGN